MMQEVNGKKEIIFVASQVDIRKHTVRGRLSPLQ